MASAATLAKPATPAPASAPAADPHAGNKKAVQLVPFVRAAHEHVEPFLDTTVQMDGNTHVIGPNDVPAYGYFRSVFLRVDATGGVGGGATVAKFEDAPWSIISEIVLYDVNGAQFVGPMTGHDLYLANKFGGYNFWTDPALGPIFSDVVVGAGASGNFSFAFRVPVEISARDALGALANENATSTYKLRITMAASTGVYNTAPATTLPAVRWRAWLEAWTQPNATDLRGAPQQQQPSEPGTTQFWTQTTKNISAGAQTVRLDRLGNLVRTLIFVFRNNTPVRDSTDFPDPLSFRWDGREIFNVGRDIIRHNMWERYGFLVSQLDTGVFVLDFTHDFDGHPGGELRDLYLPTTTSARLEVVGSFGVAGVLKVITNDVQPMGDIYQPAA